MGNFITRIPGGSKTMIIALLILFIGLIVGLNLYRNSNEVPLEVSTAQVKEEEMGSAVYSSGTIELVEKQEVYAPADRLVRRVNVQVGDKVQIGDIVAELEADKEALSLVEAQARLAKEEVNYEKYFSPTKWDRIITQAEYNRAHQIYELSKTNVERAEQLYEAGAISLKEYEQAKSQLAADNVAYLKAQKELDITENGPQGAERRSLQASFNGAQQAVRIAEENIAQFIVPARIAAEVMAVEIVPGDVTQPGKHMITLGNPSKLEVHLGIGEYDAARVKKGQEVTIEAAAFPDQEFKGTVLEVSQKAVLKQKGQSQQVEIPVRIAVDSASPGLLPGFTVDIKITIIQAEKRLVLPYEAVVEKDNNTYVFLIKDGKAQKQDIKLGLKGDLYVEVIGLNKDDVVILSPPDNMVEGKNVKAAKKVIEKEAQK